MSVLQPGMAVTPTIRLLRPLGAGGMGSVWVAEHLALRTQVVVKFMSVELAASPEAVQRFSREAAAAAQVKSPHVVQMLDHGVTETGVPFIAMELLEGYDLAQHLERHALSVGEIAQIIGQAAKALGRAHERGIVHRDIKPENIFLCDVGNGELFVKLLDFGIAKGGDGGGALASGTKTGATIGTPYFMSPEQIVGSKNIDARSDLWSLGIVAYQCIVGSKPFDADTFGALAVMIHSGPPPVPSSVNPSVPPGFDAWFAKACAREPSARFANAKQLADTFAAVARFEPFSAAGLAESGPRDALGGSGSRASAAPPLPRGTTPMAALGTGSGRSPSVTGRGATHDGMGVPAGPQPAKSGNTGARIALGLVALVVLGGAAVGGVVALKSGSSAGAAPPASGMAPVVAAPEAPAASPTSAPELTPAADPPAATPIASVVATQEKPATVVSSAPSSVSTARPTGAARTRPTAPATTTAAAKPPPVPAKNDKDIF